MIGRVIGNTFGRVIGSAIDVPNEGAGDMAGGPIRRAADVLCPAAARRDTPVMGWRFTLWATLLGFSGGFAGLYVAASMWPGVHNAPGWGMVVGAVVGALLGCGFVALTRTGRPGD